MEFREIDDKISSRGFDQKDVPAEYKEAVQSTPEWVRDIKRLISQLPEKISLASGESIDLKDCTVLDLGCGPGTVTSEIKDKVGKVIAIDKAKEMVAFLKKDFAQAENVQAVAGDVVAIPLADKSVEAEIAAGVVPYLPPRVEVENNFLREMMRVLKFGGVCIIDNISNSKYGSLAKSFMAEKTIELKSSKVRALRRWKGSGEPLTSRDFVFLDCDIKDDLAKLGYDCEVEPVYAEGYEPEHFDHCAVKLTLKGIKPPQAEVSGEKLSNN